GASEKSGAGMRVAEVKPAASMPKPVVKSAGAVYKYLSIMRQGTDAIVKADVSFRVEKAWFASNNFDSEKVSLQRYHAGSWSLLPTSMVGEDAVFYHYRAETPGFSIFAITGVVKEVRLEKSSAVSLSAPDVKTVSEGVVPESVDAAVPVSGGVAVTGSVVGVPVRANPFVGLLIVLALVLAGVFGWRRYKSARRGR
ncbi:PGF-pre-PGF domain-containing protein, partial [Candidatus Woesearchaeota archaeon]|nr:PGF-pre-PGF domain-containing protein [Candidatus Woesearchaeota archaeon]